MAWNVPHRTAALALGLTALLLLVPTGVVEEAAATYHGGGGGTVDAVVHVQNFAFEDQDTGTSVTKVSVGDTVQFVWVSGCHSVTQGVRGAGSDPVGVAAGFDSGVQCTSYDDAGDPATTFNVTFQEEGVVKYYCRPHLPMEGQIVVTGSV